MLLIRSDRPRAVSQQPIVQSNTASQSLVRGLATHGPSTLAGRRCKNLDRSRPCSGLDLKASASHIHVAILPAKVLTLLYTSKVMRACTGHGVFLRRMKLNMMMPLLLALMRANPYCYVRTMIMATLSCSSLYKGNCKLSLIFARKH